MRRSPEERYAELTWRIMLLERQAWNAQGEWLRELQEQIEYLKEWRISISNDAPWNDP